MPVCAVNKCKITSSEVTKRKVCISFHCFPKEKSLRARWAKFCGLANDPGKTLYICSQHFTREMFCNNANIQSLVMPDTATRHRLVKNAYPSIRKPNDPVCSARTARYELKERKITVAALLDAHEKRPEEEQPQTKQADNPQNRKSDNSGCPIDELVPLPPQSFELHPFDTHAPYNDSHTLDCGLNHASSSSNLDVLFEAIELSEKSKTTNATEPIGRNDPLFNCGISIEMNQSTLLNRAGFTRMQQDDDPNDSGWVEFESDMKQESSRIENNSISDVRERSQIQKLEDKE